MITVKVTFSGKNQHAEDSKTLNQRAEKPCVRSVHLISNENVHGGRDDHDGDDDGGRGDDRDDVAGNKALPSQ